MNKKIILAIGILLLISIAGCSSGSIFGKKNTGKNPITDVDVRKGTTGLEMNFVPNAPPDKVFEDGVFPLYVNMKNSGAADINDGVLVFGLENAFIDLVDPEGKYKTGLNIGIKGKSVYNPQGDQDFKQLNAKAKKIGPQSETHTSTIFATACYPYNTLFGTSACIDTDIIGERKGQKVCVIKDLTFSEGQGAPVKVTKVETRMLPRDDGKIKPSFIIEIENSGNGEVVDSNKVKDACKSSSLDYKAFNTLVVSASLSGIPLKCGEDETGIMRLKDKKDVIRCTLEGDGIDTSVNAYTTPLKVELNYGYTFTISKNIIIEKVLTH